jgi:hypothetical protein
VCDVTLGLSFALTLELSLGPQPCNPFALVASPKLGLRPKGNNDNHKCMALKGVVTKCKGNVANGDQVYFIVM